MIFSKDYTHGFRSLLFPHHTIKNRHILVTMILIMLFSLSMHTPAAVANENSYEYKYVSNNDFQQSVKDAQTLRVPDTAANQIVVERFDFEVIAPPPEPEKPKTRPAPNAAVVGEAQAYARTLVANDAEWNCLYNLWQRESGWRVEAYNASSGATGIPQALPGSKMASAGADWETNPVTQINWGMSYINGRYGSPCGAWSHSEAKGWY